MLKGYKEIKTCQGKIKGFACSGIASVVYFERLNICFDIGFAPEWASQANIVLITHGHNDHIGGIYSHYRMSRLLRNGETLPKYYIPKTCFKGLKDVHKGFFNLEHHYEFNDEQDSKFDYNILEDEIIFNFKNNKYKIKALKTIHRVYSQGYVIYIEKKKLKKQYIGKNIKELKDNGIDVEENVWYPLIGYTGDTTIDGIINNYEFLDVEILIMECTFLCDKTKGHEKKFTHVHIDDFIDNIDKFNNKEIIMCHMSKRYDKNFVENLHLELLNKNNKMSKVKWLI